MSSIPPSRLLPLSLTQTLEANWELPLADLPSYTGRQPCPRQQSLAHYPQQGSALLEPELLGRTWLTSQRTRVMVATATTTWQQQLGKIPLHRGLIG